MGRWDFDETIEVIHFGIKDIHVYRFFVVTGRVPGKAKGTNHNKLTNRKLRGRETTNQCEW